MELTDFQTIADLLSASEISRRVGSGTPHRAAAGKRERATRMARCRCGRCATCQENDRWERIFQEKFADPTYYAPRPIRRTSPLL